MIALKKIALVLLVAMMCSFVQPILVSEVFAAGTSIPTSTPTPAGGNAQVKQSEVDGCSSNHGIFSGLIKTGQEVFEGLRELIYVVSGFGIIAVAIGGFFGNMNWKWLGAIVISLVVIASTGELITAVTGCENFTNEIITDTLK